MKIFVCSNIDTSNLKTLLEHIPPSRQLRRQNMNQTFNKMYCIFPLFSPYAHYKIHQYLRSSLKPQIIKSWTVDNLRILAFKLWSGTLSIFNYLLRPSHIKKLCIHYPHKEKVLNSWLFVSLLLSISICLFFCLLSG